MTQVVGASRNLFLISLFLIFAPEIPANAESSSTEAALVEANSDFTFKGQPIHPGLIKAFQNWLSDYRPPITVTLDVGAAYGTNQFADAVAPARDGGVSITLAGIKGPAGPFIQGRWLALRQRQASNTLVL